MRGKKQGGWLGRSVEGVWVGGSERKGDENRGVAGSDRLD